MVLRPKNNNSCSEFLRRSVQLNNQLRLNRWRFELNPGPSTSGRGWASSRRRWPPISSAFTMSQTEFYWFAFTKQLLKSRLNVTKFFSFSDLTIVFSSLLHISHGNNASSSLTKCFCYLVEGQHGTSLMTSFQRQTFIHSH